jgi:DNA-binding MarR family transcriptional regulator
MMTSEEVAERYHDRTGFRLIDYREVALPTYSVATRVLTLARKRIPVIEEFLLRGLAAELASPEELAAFFGLDQRIVNGALASLASSDDVALGASDTSRRQVLRLTTKGRNTLENLESVVPEERVIQLPFDAILRRLREQAGVPLLFSREADAQGLFHIPPTKVRKPDLADITPEAVEALLKRVTHDADGPRDVLAVKAITRCERKFIPAIALLYESERGGEFQLAFAIDGVLSPEHESAFAAAGGLARLNIAETVVRSKRERTSDLQRAIDLATPALETDAELRRITAQRKSELRTLREQANRTEDVSQVQALHARIEELEHSLASAELRRSQITTRFLYCYDHAPLLQEALATAKSRVLIISPWIKSVVVDDQLKGALTQLLQRGVELYIGWGYPHDDERPSISAGAQRFLESLAHRFKNFYFKEFGDTHAKVLLVDTDYVVHTSFNWLSFRGDPDRTFRDEQGVLVADPDQVEKKFQELLPRFA